MFGMKTAVDSVLLERIPNGFRVLLGDLRVCNARLVR